MDRLDAKGVALHVMSMGGGALDTGEPTGRMMLPQSEHGAALAERQVREAEGRVARQAAVVERFEAAGDALVAEKARDALIAMRVGLAIAHLYWLVELAGRTTIRIGNPATRSRLQRLQPDQKLPMWTMAR